MHEFDFRSYFGLNCRDEFPHYDSIFTSTSGRAQFVTDQALNPHESDSLFTSTSGRAQFVTDQALNPHESSCFEEVDSVDQNYYDKVLCCSDRKSSKIVWLSVLTTNV